MCRDLHILQSSRDFYSKYCVNLESKEIIMSLVFRIVISVEQSLKKRTLVPLRID